MLPILLSSAYLPPVQYFAKMLTENPVFIEREEHYLKQTYRNRCNIASANGVLSLTVPVEKTEEKCAVRDVRISKHSDWQTLHWRAIFSAYGSTPFFEYYQDDLRPFYEKEWKFLFDFNSELLAKILELLDLNPDIHYTNEYRAFVPDADDFRLAINPRNPAPDEHFRAVPYYQVFRERFGFQSNLSIIDLLFNMGTESLLVLQKCCV